MSKNSASKLIVCAVTTMVGSYILISGLAGYNILKVKKSTLNDTNMNVEEVMNLHYGNSGKWIYDKNTSKIIYQTDSDILLSFSLNEDESISKIDSIEINGVKLNKYETKSYIEMLNLKNISDNDVYCEKVIPETTTLYEYNNNSYKYNKNLPCGILSKNGVRDIDKFKNSEFMNTHVKIDDLYQNAEYETIAKYDNGSLIKVFINNEAIGDYILTIFCDKEESKYYCIKVVDLENAETVEDINGIQKHIYTYDINM